MKELSLNILDIAQNSVTAGSTCIHITLTETPSSLSIVIADDGCGMPPEMVARVTDPFCTTRKTRKVGLGIPLFKLAAEQTGGSFAIRSSVDPVRHGTETTAVFRTDSIDCMPLGDITSSLCTLIQGAGKIDIVFQHALPDGTVSLDTREMRAVLGDVPLSAPDVQVWIRENLREQYQAIPPVKKEIRINE